MELFNVIPVFGNVAFTIVAFIIAISIIVAVHEYGHYIVGRWCGIKADVFSLGFGPVLWSKPDKHGTVWQVAAIPMGGYVKFRGDANAASVGSTEEAVPLTAEERRATMHGAPLWARSATVVAGPMFNFIMSIIIFAGFLFYQGVASDPITVEEITEVPSLATELQPGDEILEIAGKPSPLVSELSGFVRELPQELTLDYVIRRDGSEQSITAPHPFTSIVSSFSPNSAAEEAGLLIGDRIIAVDEAPVTNFFDLLDIVEGSEGNPLEVRLLRGGEEMALTIKPRVIDLPNADGGFDSDYKIGITTEFLFSMRSETPGLGQAVGFGVERVWNIAKVSVSTLYNIATMQINRCNMSGMVGIARTAGEAASRGVADFISIIAMLSAAIGLLNLFPIPVLDGGHLVFYAYEAVFRRPPSDKALNVLMAIGLTLVLSLMLFGLTNDFTC